MTIHLARAIAAMRRTGATIDQISRHYSLSRHRVVELMEIGAREVKHG